MNEPTLDRRRFIALAAVTAGYMATSPARVLGANERVRLGLIGAGARGQEILKQALAVPNVECVAIADVYTRRHDEVR